MLQRVFQARVASITEEFRKINYRQVIDAEGNRSWIHDSLSLGWFVALEGSHEKLFFGMDRPGDLNVGDKVQVTIEKMREK